MRNLLLLTIFSGLLSACGNDACNNYESATFAITRSAAIPPTASPTPAATASPTPSTKLVANSNGCPTETANNGGCVVDQFGNNPCN